MESGELECFWKQYLACWNLLCIFGMLIFPYWCYLVVLLFSSFGVHIIRNYSFYFINEESCFLYWKKQEKKRKDKKNTIWLVCRRNFRIFDDVLYIERRGSFWSSRYCLFKLGVLSQIQFVISPFYAYWSIFFICSFGVVFSVATFFLYMFLCVCFLS